jgi:hypothetical protein
LSNIRPCRDDERMAILAIVNPAAEAYRGVIPADCFHEPYIPPAELDSELAAGVAFWLTARWSASWASSRCVTSI